MLQLGLLIRHSKGIEPTPAGVALLDHARTILGNLAQLETELVGYREGTRGHVRLFVNKSVILESLTQGLGQFLLLHPMVRVELAETISPQIVEAVVENRADIGIFGGNIFAPSLQCLPYRRDWLVALLPTDHRLAHRETVWFGDLVDQEFISLEKGSSIDTLCVKAAAELGHQLKLRVRGSGFDAVSHLVRAQMGIGIVPQEITTGRSDGLSTVLLEENWAHRTLMLAVRDRASMPPATRLLVNHLLGETPARRRREANAIVRRDGRLKNDVC